MVTISNVHSYKGYYFIVENDDGMYRVRYMTKDTYKPIYMPPRHVYNYGKVYCERIRYNKISGAVEIFKDSVDKVKKANTLPGLEFTDSMDYEIESTLGEE